MTCPLENDNRQCHNCGNYSYDTHYDEHHCKIFGQCPYPYQEGGVDCNDWICEHEQRQINYTERNKKLAKEVEEYKALYEAEKLLRKAAENNG